MGPETRYLVEGVASLYLYLRDSVLVRSFWDIGHWLAVLSLVRLAVDTSDESDVGRWNCWLYCCQFVYPPPLFFLGLLGLGMLRLWSSEPGLETAGV